MYYPFGHILVSTALYVWASTLPLMNEVLRVVLAFTSCFFDFEAIVDHERKDGNSDFPNYS